MPVFEYKGYNADGRKTSGIVDADNSKSARVKLRKQGIMTTLLTADTGGAREFLRAPLAALTSRISSKDISTFTRQLSTMQDAGLTLIESLEALIDQTYNVRFKKVITDIREQVTHGSSLANSLASHPSHFDDMYVNLVRAGEASGALGQTLEQLANFNENRMRQKSKLAASMVYPVIMTLVGSSILLFLLGYVVPKTQAMFEDMSQALPLPTVILLTISSFLANWWMAIIVAAIAGIVGLKYYSGTEKGKRKLDRLALDIPIFGIIIKNSNVARFAGALGILMSGGVELIEALRITEKTLDNSTMADAIAAAAVSVTEGEPIASPLKNTGLFPPIVIQMIATGEKSGSLVKMLNKITEAYEFEVETALTALTAMVEPILILVMGSVVGFVVMAILLPIFELSHIVG